MRKRETIGMADHVATMPLKMVMVVIPTWPDLPYVLSRPRR